MTTAPVRASQIKSYPVCPLINTQIKRMPCNIDNKRILLSPYKEGGPASCNDTEEPGEHHAK